MNNEINGILSHYEWKEGNTLFYKDHLGEIFRFNRNYETLTEIRKAITLKRGKKEKEIEISTLKHLFFV